MAFDPLGERDNFTFRQPCFAHGIDPHRSLQATRHMRGQFCGRRHTQDHTGTGFVDATFTVTFDILKRRISSHQGQQLRRVRPLHCLGWDTEGQRIKGYGIDESTAAAIGLVLGPWIAVIIVFGQPMRGRHIRQQVATLKYITPESGHIPASREDRAHAHNGNRSGSF